VRRRGRLNQTGDSIAAVKYETSSTHSYAAGAAYLIGGIDRRPRWRMKMSLRSIRLCAGILIAAMLAGCAYTPIPGAENAVAYNAIASAGGR
jgi:hypothetical protein